MKNLKNTVAAFLGCFLITISINIQATNLQPDDTTEKIISEDMGEIEQNSNVYDNIFYKSGEVPPTVSATAAILADVDSGRILYSKNGTSKIYPASITKLLTTLVATEYIKEDDIIVVGNEINLVPWDSSKSGHIVGESIAGINLFRGLLLPSGNDTSNVVALNVARIYTNNPNLTFDEAEIVFAKLMNEKAKEIGALNSNFVSPHGYHDDNHYSTPEDLLTISLAALKNDTISNIVSEYEFVGNGAGVKRTVDMVTQEYKWINTNALLGGKYYYRYATGVKTGYTSQAGRCLVARASKDNKNLISIVLGCEDTEQFTESTKLLEFGFNTYNLETLQENNVVRREINLDNPRLGDSDILELLNTNTVTKLLSAEELENIESEVIINTEYISNKTTEEGDITLIADISAGSEIATISYTLYDTLIYEGSLVAANDVLPRTFSSDAAYYWGKIKSVIFSWLIIPILISLFMITIFTLRFINQIKAKNKKKNRLRSSKDKYKFKTKY